AEDDRPGLLLLGQVATLAQNLEDRFQIGIGVEPGAETRGAGPLRQDGDDVAPAGVDRLKLILSLVDRLVADDVLAVDRKLAVPEAVTVEVEQDLDRPLLVDRGRDKDDRAAGRLLLRLGARQEVFGFERVVLVADVFKPLDWNAPDLADEPRLGV